MTTIQNATSAAQDLLTQQTQSGVTRKASAFSLSAAAATASGSTATSAADATDITGADFLTLLVSEMKNQDPTQPTDPQAYVQQLVGVNSLQQLIAINKDLGGA